MGTDNFNVILNSNTNSNLVFEDYASSFPKIYNRGLKIGLIGTVLLCTQPNIYANELKYQIVDSGNKASIDCAREYSDYMDSYITSVSELNKLNYTKKDIIRNILSFKALNNNWDGYHALPLEIDSASNAIFIINEIGEKLAGKIDDFYPNTHGTISFEWINALEEKLHLEIGNESFSFFVKYNSLEPLFFNDQELNSENVSSLADFIKSI